MSFGSAIMKGVKNYARLHGRASRSEFWWWLLFSLLVAVAASLADGLLGLSDSNPSAEGPIAAVASLILILPSISVAVRRLHDVAHSGWWYLIGFTIVGVIPLLIWFCRQGTSGPNRFGEDPSGDRQPASGPPMSAPAPLAGDALGRLEHLGRLRERGVLTDQEFTAEKARILGAQQTSSSAA